MEHHVYFWLKEKHRNDADKASFEEGLANLLRLPGVASGIWGTSAPTPERPVTEKSWDYAISLRFDSLSDHDTYQDDPEHEAFLETFRDWWEKVDVRDLLAAG